MRSEQFFWRGKLVRLNIGRMVIRGSVLPAVLPQLFLKNVSANLHFQIGTLKSKDGYPIVMHGFNRNISFDARGYDLFFPAALPDEQGELALTDEFVLMVASRSRLSETRQDDYENLLTLREEALASGVDPKSDPDFRYMVDEFWARELRSARGDLDREDVEKTKILMDL